jgi:hypothetical protein
MSISSGVVRWVEDAQDNYSSEVVSQSLREYEALMFGEVFVVLDVKRGQGNALGSTRLSTSRLLALVDLGAWRGP